MRTLPLVPIAAGLSVAAVVSARMLVEPMQPYGDGAAHYIEHALRLEVLLALRTHTGSLAEAIRLADETVLSHPPGLHLLTLGLGPLAGPTAGETLWTGLLWLTVLGVAMASIGWTLTGRRAVAQMAGLGTVLVPAIGATATRYHYDLPMTALLWASVACLLLGRRRRPLLWGAASGTLFFLAAVVKWTALPFGLPMLAGAVLCRPGPTPTRLRETGMSAAAAAVIGAGLLLTFLGITRGSFDASRLAAEDPAIGAIGLAWYPLALIVSVFSPLGAAVLAWPLWHWFRHDRRGWRLLAATCGVQLGFLIVLIARPDERFVLTLAPALVLAAAIGASRLPERTRRRLVQVSIAVGLAIAIEFHFGPAGPWNGSVAVLNSGPTHPAVELRGLFLADSFEQRGWGAGSTTQRNRSEMRQALWDELVSCNDRQVAVETSLLDDGDVWWFRYRTALDAVREGRPLAPTLVLGPARIASHRFWWPNPDTFADAEMHYAPLGFTMEMLPELIPEAQADDAGDRKLLARLGINPAALEHFQPQLGLSRLPLAPHSQIPASWTVLREFRDERDGLRLGLLGRSASTCSSAHR